jgi:hypothetical protein
MLLPSQVHKLFELVSDFSDWKLALFEHLANHTKSVVIPLAILSDSVSLENAFKVARVDEDYQIRQWGYVEGIYGHTGDILATKIWISSARTFLALCDLHPAFALAKDAHTNCTKEEAEAYHMLSTGSKDGKKRDAHERYLCGCGSAVRESFRQRHQMSKKHVDYLERLGLRILMPDKLKGDYAPTAGEETLSKLLNSKDIYDDEELPDAPQPGQTPAEGQAGDRDDVSAIDRIEPHPDLARLLAVNDHDEFDPSQLAELDEFNTTRHGRSSSDRTRESSEEEHEDLTAQGDHGDGTALARTHTPAQPANSVKSPKDDVAKSKERGKGRKAKSSESA